MPTDLPPPDRDDAATRDDDVDLDDWLAALAGRNDAASNNTAPRSLAEARVLRAAVMREPEAGTVPVDDDHAWQRLRFRLRREGLFEAAAPVRRIWLPRVGLAMAAALMLTVALRFWPGGDASELFPLTPGEPVVYRGGIVLLAVPAADPVRAARRLAAQLAKVGVRPVVQRDGARAVLDVDVDEARLAAVRDVVNRAGIDGAKVAAGLLRLRFEPAAGVQGKS